jgi:hypothetical protein
MITILKGTENIDQVVDGHFTRLYANRHITRNDELSLYAIPKSYLSSPPVSSVHPRR